MGHHLRIEFLNPKLTQHHAELLTALVAALNDRAKLPNLDRFPEWRDQGSCPARRPVIFVTVGAGQSVRSALLVEPSHSQQC